jgi:hypothetical protein
MVLKAESFGIPVVTLAFFVDSLVSGSLMDGNNYIYFMRRIFVRSVLSLSLRSATVHICSYLLLEDAYL